MTLGDTIGARFSELTDNHEPSKYSPPSYTAWHPLERYGFLPDGSYFGIGKVRSIAEYWEDDIILVGPDGFILECCINIDGGAIGRDFPMPSAIVASPSGKSIVWLAEGQLWVWRQDPWEGRFSSFCVHRVLIPDSVMVEDARMNGNGILDVWCADGRHYDYASDADALLAPGKWGPLLCLYEFPFDHRFKWNAYVKDCVEAVPDIAGLLVCDNSDCLHHHELPDGIREIRFASDCGHIGEWPSFFAPNLERVVLSGGVEEVGEGAFAFCRKLSELVVEGDVSRLAGWDAEAFMGCPCEKMYQEMRDRALAEGDIAGA